MRENILLTQFIKKDGTLQFRTQGAASRYKIFVDALEEGQSVEVFLEANNDNGTLPQLAKIHACLKKLAQDTGESVAILKLEVKKKAGLTIDLEDNYVYVKSFGDCSKEELGLAIQEIYEMAAIAGTILDSDLGQSESQPFQV